jgi:hypothetical protein
MESAAEKDSGSGFDILAILGEQAPVMPTIFSLAFSHLGHLATRLPSSYRQGGLDSSPTARIEQTPFHRARSASTGNEPGCPAIP